MNWVYFAEFTWEAGWPGSEGRTETQYDRAEVMARSVGQVEEMLADHWGGNGLIVHSVHRLHKATHAGQQIVLLDDEQD